MMSGLADKNVAILWGVMFLLVQSLAADLYCKIDLKNGTESRLSWSQQYSLEEEKSYEHHAEEVQLSPFWVHKNFDNDAWIIKLMIETADSKRTISTLVFKENSWVENPLILYSGNFELHVSCCVKNSEPENYVGRNHRSALRRLFRALLEW